MNTLHHAFWTYVVARKKKDLVKWFVIGAIWPDIIYFVMFLFAGVQKEAFTSTLFLDLLKLPAFGFSFDAASVAATHEFICKLFEHPIVDGVRIAMHSLFIWTLAFGLIAINSGVKLSPIKAFLWGWLGHVVTDLFTHASDAIPIFWPVSDMVIRSPVSYWHPDYYGREFGVINAILTFLAVFYLISDAWKRRKQEKKVQARREDFSPIGVRTPPERN